MVFFSGLIWIRFRVATLVVSFFLIGLNGVCQDTVTLNKDQTNDKVSWGLSTDVNSKFLWRGISVNDGLVLQPDLWASYKNFTVGMWCNATIFDRNHDPKDLELDPYFGYSWSIGNLQIEHSVMVYYCIGEQVAPTTAELFLGVTYPIGDFAINTIIAADFVAYFGSLYFEHGLFYEKQLNDKFTLGSSAVFGWGNGKFNDSYETGTTKTALNLFSLNAELTYNPKGIIYFKPHLQIGRTLDSEISTYLSKYPWFCGLLIGFEL
jgi:uncharacterized protein (TIGR02001 family)